MVQAFVGLGANLGEPIQTLQWAARQLDRLPATCSMAQSSLYRSAPVDAVGPDFFNAVVVINTRMEPLPLLHALQQIEQLAGRERPYRHAPRTLDLDLLLYAEERINTPELQVPHPRMWQRAFVLIPLAEVAPQWVTAAQLLDVQGQPVMRLQRLAG